MKSTLIENLDIKKYKWAVALKNNNDELAWACTLHLNEKAVPVLFRTRQAAREAARSYGNYEAKPVRLWDCTARQRNSSYIRNDSFYDNATMKRFTSVVTID